MLKRKFKKSLKELTKKYFKNEYTDSVEVFRALASLFEDERLSPAQQHQVKKFMLLFFGTFDGFTNT